VRGNRKILIGLFYLVGVFGVAALMVLKGSPLDWVSYGVFAGGAATGVGAVIWGNVQEHKAKATQPNGGGQ
jgi:hypothetical protein